MEPLLHNRISTVELSVDVTDLEVGDVILYKRDNGRYILHRIVKIQGQCLFTRGDNRIDIEKISSSQVLGKMIAYYPGVGPVLITCDDTRYLKYLRTLKRRYREIWLKKMPLRISNKVKKVLFRQSFANETLKLSDAQDLLLKIMASVLFGKELPIIEKDIIDDLFVEARIQTVYFQVYDCILNYLSPDLMSSWEKAAMKVYAQNLEIAMEHERIHELMTQHGIPYVSIKGMASAKYYPHPLHRMMGDVDFIVRTEDIEKTSALLLNKGLSPLSENAGLMHDKSFYGFQGEHRVVVELHPSVTGIPAGKAGNIVREYLGDLINKAELCQLRECKCIVPNDRHHCLILLVHTATHLIKEGIGLRHLCDWATFINQIPDDIFETHYRKMLEDCGLMRFAQLLTQVCEKYLGMPAKSWSGYTNEDLLRNILIDIFAGGNFGRKEPARYQQIKYISNRNDNTVDDKTAMKQVIQTIKVKAKDRHPKISRFFLTRPFGWAMVAGDYLGMLITGKRRLMNPISTINNAAERKKIYQQFELYKRGTNEI